MGETSTSIRTHALDACAYLSSRRPSLTVPSRRCAVPDCPQGPTRPVLAGPRPSNEQWAPAMNGENQWILIGTLDGSGAARCMEYATLHAGRGPPWGRDGSRSELKKHVLCCTDRRTEEVPRPTSRPSDDVATDTGATTRKGTWFHITNGWNAGSHDDAIHYCAIKNVNGIAMELCPYDAYCPAGPSFPPVAGRAEAGGNEDSEQWAPTSDGTQWVLVGMHGRNRASQCLTQDQLYGAAASSEDLGPQQKHYVRCCRTA